jgi:predicted membrane channel-forming protein YqfA (hemolysin III family)
MPTTQKLVEAVYVGIALMPVFGITEGVIKQFKLSPLMTKYVSVYFSGALLYTMAHDSGVAQWYCENECAHWLDVPQIPDDSLRGGTIQCLMCSPTC